ncbi:MAG: hypothetical protein OIF35_08575 [Cellvibrionaceae bacterium]|nr:hypothetical protein [Cellvibrionaceae bacterium]MCV6625204.1 hypothetical protein [Cellvibrionaceae bacterium]
MSGEYATAAALLDNACKAAETDPAMSCDTLFNALLGILLQKQAQSHGKADVLSFVEFQLDHLGDDEVVVTRGC